MTRGTVTALTLLASLALTTALRPPSVVAATDPAPPWLYVLRSVQVDSQTPSAPELLAINPATQHVVARITLPAADPIPGDRSGDFAIAPDARRAYVATSAGLVVVDLVTNTVTGLIDVGGSARRLALLPDGSRLFVTRRDFSGAVVVDPVMGTITGALATTSARELTLSPDGSRLYVLGTGMVAEFDTASNALLREIPVSGARQVLVHPATNRLYLMADSLRESIVAHDLTTGAVISTLELPNLYEDIPGVRSTYGGLGFAVVTADGSRLVVPHFYTGSSSGSLGGNRYGEFVRVVSTAGMTLESTLVPPRESAQTPLNGAPQLTIWREGTTVYGAGPVGAFSVDPIASTAELVGPGLTSAAERVLAVSPHACAAEVWPQQRYVRESGGTMTVDVPVPAGCAWSASTSDSWLGITSASSGVGPGSLSLAAQASAAPRSASVIVAGQRVTITQLDSEIEVFTPAPSQVLSQPLVVSGWAIDRPSTDRGDVDTGTDSGIEAVIVSATPASGGQAVVLNEGTTNTVNAAVEATYGYRYRTAAFSIPVSRLAPGDYTLVVQARSKWDGALITATRPVSIARQPVVDLGTQPTEITQPYQLTGWAADLAAATGTGIDAIEVTAARPGEAAVVLPGVAYGLSSPNAAANAGVSPADFLAGFEIWLRNLAAGTYTITVRARSIATGQFDAQASRVFTVRASAPDGAFDTPTSGATDLEGTIAVTGWAIDDYRVDRVEIWRGCIESVDRPRGICRAVTPGAPADDVFVGNANFLPGARPDVRTLFPNHYNADRAGWGYLLLTNALPHIPNGLPEGGQGTFTLAAYAVDGDGLYTELATKVITINNDAASRPFGAIDTPEQGATIPGPAFPFNEAHAYPVFGWAVTQSGKCIDTSQVASYRVYIDGVAHTLTPGVNWFSGLNRADVAAAYPGLCNSNNAVAAYYLDTTTLANGLHTIGWDVIDNNNQVAGIGSRFFNVSSVADTPAPAFSRGPLTTTREVRATVGPADTAVEIRPDRDGVYRVRLPQTGRLAVDLGGSVDRGYESRDGAAAPLPAGSTLLAQEGRFFWQAPAAFLGTFPLTFVDSGGRVELEVTIVEPMVDDNAALTITSPRAGANPNPVITVAGTARDPQTISGSGISAVHVWAYRKDVAAVPPQFLGEATLTDDHYTLTTAPLQPGTYEIAVFAWIARTASWAPATTVTIAVR